MLLPGQLLERLRLATKAPWAWAEWNPSLQKGKRVLSRSHVFGQSMHPDPASSVRAKFRTHVGNCSPAKLPDTSQGPTSQAGLVKESSIRPTRLTPFCTVSRAAMLSGKLTSWLETLRPVAGSGCGYRRTLAQRDEFWLVGCLPWTTSHHLNPDAALQSLLLENVPGMTKLSPNKLTLYVTLLLWTKWPHSFIL